MKTGSEPPPPPELPGGTDDDLVEVGAYTSEAAAREHALVALAAGADCWIEPLGDDAVPEADPGPDGPDSPAAVLRVQRSLAPKVAEELAGYAEEQRDKPEPVRLEPPRHSPGLPFALLWASLLMAVFLWQRQDPGLQERWASSATGLLVNREIWRPFTALFLHADLEHLLSNILPGVLFGILAARALGAVAGWLLLLACGALGNVLSCLLHQGAPMYVSLGASTAVFAALGILSGYGLSIALRAPDPGNWARVWWPLPGGLILLAWMGGGAPPVDVTAHLCGFACGFAGGFLSGRWQRLIPVEPAAGPVNSSRGAGASHSAG